MKLRSISVALSAAALGIACGTFGADPSTSGDADAGPSVDGSSSGSDAPAEAAPPCDAANVANDPHHCGACGHDCLGGECTAGVCQPVILARSPQDAPIFDVALLADSVVWATNDEPLSGGPNHGLYFCPKTGCPDPPVNLADGSHNPIAIATDGEKLAYVDFPGNGINGVFLATASGFTMFAPHSAAHWMKVVPDGLLFVVNTPDTPPNSRTIFHANGTSETTPCVFMPSSSANVQVAAYANGFAFLGAVNISYIASCSLTGNTVDDFMTQGDSVASITASGSTVFWTGGGDGVLAHCTAAAKCPAPTFETGLGVFREVMSSGKDLLLAAANGDLLRCDPEQCSNTKTVVAHATTMGTSRPIAGHALASDDKAYYFAAATSALDGSNNATGWYLAKVAR